MFRYRLHARDGDDLGDAVYVDPNIAPGETVISPDGRSWLVVDVVPADRDDRAVRALLMVEAARLEGADTSGP